MGSRVCFKPGQSGQAAVEAALSMPLTVFLMLGTLQLFLMLQGRILAEYAAFRAVRTGIYWYPLRIPFADWVISRLTLARWGLEDYTAQDPLTPVKRANWTVEDPTTLEGAIRTELLRRVSAGFYSLPIHASASLRMMTPVRQGNFQTQNCAPAPEFL